jgi:endonuclease III
VLPVVSVLASSLKLNSGGSEDICTLGGSLESVIEVEHVYDLELLTYPSFALPLFDVSGLGLVKRYGFCSGLRVKASPYGYVVSHGDPKCVEYSKFILGLWFDPELYYGGVSGDFKPIVSALLEAYRGFGLSVSPLDDLAVFTSIVLSRRTDYHVNTVRWLRSLLELYVDLAGVASVDPGELSSRISRSFHLRMLPNLVKCYLGVRGEALSGVEGTRGLFKCSGVGPKTFYSYILHVLLDTSYAPIDVNLEVFLENMGFGGFGSKPQRRYCALYDCNSCPLRSSCLEARLREHLGRLTGWFQTVAYIHVKRFCRRGACSSCSLRSLCVRSSQGGRLGGLQPSRV